MADKYSHFDMRAFRGHFRIASDHFEGMCKQFETLESLYKKAQADNEKLTAERDKYRDACERLIGHYYGGDGYFHNVGEPKFIEIDEFGDKYNFARQVEAKIKGESK